MHSAKIISQVFFKSISLSSYKKYAAAILSSSLLILGSLFEFFNKSHQVHSCQVRIVPLYTHSWREYLGFSQGCDFVMETALLTSKIVNIFIFLMGKSRIKLIPKLKMLNGIPILTGGLYNGICHFRKFITQSLCILQAAL